MTALPDGKVLLVGRPGSPNDAGASSVAELYDPVAGAWTPAAAPDAASDNLSAALLPDGRVLLVVGESGAVGGKARPSQSHFALYDPAGGQWTDGGGTLSPRQTSKVLVLSDGRALVFGGTQSLRDAELGSYVGG